MRGTEVWLMELFAQLRISVKDRNSIQQCESSHRSTALCEQKEMIHQQQEDCIPCLPLSRLPSVSINCYSLNSSQDQKHIVSSHKLVNLSVSFRHVRWFPRIFSKSRVFLSLILLFYRQSLAVSSSLRTPPSRLCVSRKKTGGSSCLQNRVGFSRGKVTCPEGSTLPLLLLFDWRSPKTTAQSYRCSPYCLNVSLSLAFINLCHGLKHF